MALTFFALPHPPLAVVPILIGPLQVLLAVLPAILVAIGGALLAMFKPSSIKLGAKVLWRNKVATLLVAAVVAGLCYGIPRARQYFWPQNVAAYSGKAEWTMFRGGLSRRGGGDGYADPASGGRIWAFSSKFKTFYSSPSVVGNRILVSSADKGVFADHGGIYCLDADSGAVGWEFAPSDFRATFSSPSVDGKFVVCGEGLHLTKDARIFCLDFEKGAKQWEVRTTSHVESSACLSNGMAFCGAGADGIYGLKLDAKDNASAVKWHLKNLQGHTNDACFHCDASPATVTGLVFFSSAEVHDKDWNGIVCVRAADGKEVWHVDAPNPVWGPPTIVGDRLFVGMGNGNFVESAQEVWARRQEEMKKLGKSAAEIQAQAPRFAPGGALWCIDINTAKVLWKHPLPQTLLGAVAEADGKLYFAAHDGDFTCLTLDNVLINHWDTREGIVTSPAVGRDHVYVVTASGRLYGIDRKTFRPVWDLRLGSGNDFYSSPAVGCGHIYVGTPQDGLVCLGQPAGAAAAPIWGGPLGGPGRSGWLDGSPLPPRGTFAWRWPADTGDTNDAIRVLAPPAVLKNTLYVPVQGVKRMGFAALNISAATNAAAGSAPAAPAEQWFAATAGAPLGSAAVTQGRVYFAEGASRGGAGHLRCLDAASGRPLWQTDVAQQASGAFTLTSNALYACVRENAITCLGTCGTNAGHVSWMRSTGAPVGAPTPAGDLVLVALANPPSLAAFDAASGAVRWRVALPAAPVACPVAGEDMAAVPVTNGVLAVSLVNGGMLWKLPCLPVGASLVNDDSCIACATTDGLVLVSDWRGRVQQKLREGVGLPPMLCGDRLLYCRTGALQRVDLPGGQETRWLATGWLGTLATPPVLANGCLYFATADKGLVCAREGKR